MTGVYRPNRRRALAASALIALSAVLLGFVLLVSNLLRVTLGARLLSQGVDAYEAAVWSLRTWEDGTLAIVISGVFGMAFGGVAFFLWLTRSWRNVQALPDRDVRHWAGNADVAYLVLFPALVVAFFVVRSAYPNATAIHVAVFAAATASLAGPLLVIRRLWMASSAGGSPEPAPPVWTGILVWWAALGGAWISQGSIMVVLAQRLRYSQFDERGRQMLAAGLLEMTMSAALIVACVFIIRVIFRINSMQEGLARELPEPAPSLEGQRVPHATRATDALGASPNSHGTTGDQAASGLHGH